MTLKCEVFCAGNAVADVLARPVDALAARAAANRSKRWRWGLEAMVLIPPLR